jgi:F-type H+-transporting ATPase subunit gamma
MSDTTASLRRKIGGAGDLQSVVRTMKAVAASSIGQYEQSVRALADYYRAVEFGSVLPRRRPGAFIRETERPESCRCDYRGSVRLRPRTRGPIQ